MSWQSQPISAITQVVTKGTTPTTLGRRFTDEGVNFIKAEALNGDSGLEVACFSHIDEDTHELLGRSILHEDDVLVTIAGAQVGKCGYVKADYLPANTNQAVGIVRVDKLKAVPRYIYYFFKQRSTFALCQSLGGQAAQPNVNLTVLKSIHVPLPALCTQRAIADMLSAYDDLIENNRRRMALLEDAARELYREWFVRLRFPGHEHTRITNGVPEGWEKIYLRNKVDTQYGYTETATDEPVGPKFLRGTDINKTAFIDWSTVPYCPIDEILQRRYQLHVGDIVIIRMADPGKVAIVEREIDAVFASYLIRVRPTDSRLKPYYLFYVLSDEQYQGHISGVSTGSTRKTASAPLLVDYQLLLPSHVLLETFEDSVRPLRQQITTLLIQNEKLRAGRDLLLPRLMSGEIAA